MKKNFLSTLALLTIFTGFAQKQPFIEPDYDAIKTAVSDSATSTFYPVLMKRFLANDVTLTNDEFRLLYYGHLYQDNYAPYSPSMERNALAIYLEKKEISPADCDMILNYTNVSRIDFPFNFHHLRMAIYALHVKGKHQEADSLMTMLNGIIDAILSSGDGKSLKTAYHVIYTPHEYEIMNKLGYVAESQTLNNVWDVISIAKNRDKISALYFNVEEMLDIYREKAEKINSARKSIH
ncbi:MAG: DUF4919 domain-containing protein [Bacteroidales bacterium]|nr:DUF4919 domain-containing protein [Bacteroidales bacterium]